MSKIKRYEVEPLSNVGQSVDESPSGEWVHYSDHEEEVARLRGEIEAMRKDAERFTFCSAQGVFPVRSNGGPGWVMFIVITSARRESFFGINPREAIDAALAAMKEQAE